MGKMEAVDSLSLCMAQACKGSYEERAFGISVLSHFVRYGYAKACEVLRWDIPRKVWERARLHSEDDTILYSGYAESFCGTVSKRGAQIEQEWKANSLASDGDTQRYVREGSLRPAAKRIAAKLKVSWSRAVSAATFAPRLSRVWLKIAQKSPRFAPFPCPRLEQPARSQMWRQKRRASIINGL